jgi:hypothetical protein
VRLKKLPFVNFSENLYNYKDCFIKMDKSKTVFRFYPFISKSSLSLEKRIRAKLLDLISFEIFTPILKIAQKH